MTDFENKNLEPAASGEQEIPSAAETPVPAEQASQSQTAAASPSQAEAPSPEASIPEAPAPETASQVPHLTLEPDPVFPENPIPEAPAPASASSAQSFHMPEPPHAPEPPQPEPVYQQTPPPYNTQPPYTAPPQYQPPQYGQVPQQPYYQPQYNTPPIGYVQKSRLAAGLLALLFGTFGVHNYYLGYNTKATVQLIVSLAGGLLTCGIATAAIAIWGFIEGILILSGNGAHLYDGNGVILRD